jgi:MFS transporter, Spinster family, sphingosine-1-phosphate transporter
MNARRFAWLLVAVLWVVALLNYVDRQVIFSLFPLLSSDLRLSDVQLGLLSTVFLWVYGLLSPFSGYAADRFGRERLIAAGLLVWSAVTLATGISRSYGQLLAARAVMGLSEACYLPAALAMIARHHGPRSRSLAVGLHQSGLYAGMVLGGAAGGWAGGRYGWRAPFLALGAGGISYAGVLWLFFRRQPKPLERPAPAPRAFGASFAALRRVPGFGIMTAVFAAMAIANWIVYTWLPLYLYERFHMSLAEAGFTATFYIQGASFGGIIAGGWLADRWSAVSARGRILTQTCGLLLASPFLFLLGNTGARLALAAALVLFGIGRGFYDCNTMPVLSQAAPDELRSTGYGIFNCAGCVAGGIAAALAGALKSALGLAAAFQIAGGILFLGGVLLLFTPLAPVGYNEPSHAPTHS